MQSSIRRLATPGAALTIAALLIFADRANAQESLSLSVNRMIANDFTLLMEPMNADWETRLLPPLLQSLMRIAPYSTVRASAPEALRAVGVGTHRLALLRRSSALDAGTAEGIEWMEIGPASCLMLVVRQDATWFGYGDLNYGHHRALRVDAASPGAQRNFVRVLSEFPLASELRIQVRPALIALQRLAAWDTDLVALDVPRRDAANLPPEVMPLIDARALRLLEMPPALNSGSKQLISGEVLLSNGWFWESPTTYRTLCDPFVLAMPTANADRLVYSLQTALAAETTASAPLTAVPGFSFALQDDWEAVAEVAEPNALALLAAVAPPVSEPSPPPVVSAPIPAPVAPPVSEPSPPPVVSAPIPEPVAPPVSEPSPPPVVSVSIPAPVAPPVVSVPIPEPVAPPIPEPSPPPVVSVPVSAPVAPPIPEPNPPPVVSVSIPEPVVPPIPEPSAPPAASTEAQIAPERMNVPICDPTVPYVFRHAASSTSLELTRCTSDQGSVRLLAEPPLTNPLVLMLQRHLNDLGFKAGRPDGMIGRRTRDAIRRFQTASGMTVNGSINFNLLDRIQQDWIQEASVRR